MVGRRFISLPTSAMLRSPHACLPLERTRSPGRSTFWRPPIHAAAASWHAGIIALLLAAGTPVDTTQHGGYTALHAAANAGDPASLEVLLTSGADVNIKAGNGKSALDLAEANHHDAVIARLRRFSSKTRL